MEMRRIFCNFILLFQEKCLYLQRPFSKWKLYAEAEGEAVYIGRRYLTLCLLTGRNLAVPLRLIVKNKATDDVH